MFHLETDRSEGWVRPALDDGEQALLIWAAVRFNAPAQRHIHFSVNRRPMSADRCLVFP